MNRPSPCGAYHTLSTAPVANPAKEKSMAELPRRTQSSAHNPGEANRAPTQAAKTLWLSYPFTVSIVPLFNRQNLFGTC